MKKCTEKWMRVFVCAGCAAAMIFAGCSGQKPLSDRFEEELGEPGKIERTVVTGNENPETKEEYATAVSIVSYENGKAQYTITFNQAMKMEGFYIK